MMRICDTLKRIEKLFEYFPHLDKIRFYPHEEEEEFKRDFPHIFLPSTLNVMKILLFLGRERDLRKLFVKCFRVPRGTF
jgi:hypothetical protein